MSLNPQVNRGQNGSAAINTALASAVTMDSYAVAGLPAASAHTGKLVHCSNGAAGQPCLAYSNGTSWVRIVFGAAVNVAT